MGHQWFDTGKLGEWLDRHLGNGGGIRVENLRRVAGGMSAETYIFDAVQSAKGGKTIRPLVMRRDPVGGPIERHIEVEFGVMKALAGTPVPVPRMYGLEMDPSWLERPFFVEEFVPGTADLARFSSPEYADKRERLGEQFVDILARMHTLDIHKTGLDFLENPGEGTAPAAREVALWEDLWKRNKVEPNPLLTEAFIWMKQHLPKAPRVSLVHADYRHGNFLFEGDKINAIVDWEFAHLGDPAEDIGWFFTMQTRLVGLGMAADMDKGLFSLKGRKEFMQRYEEKAGFAVDWQATRFWEVLSEVKGFCLRATSQSAFKQKKHDLGTARMLLGLNNNMFANMTALMEL